MCATQVRRFSLRNTLYDCSVVMEYSCFHEVHIYDVRPFRQIRGHHTGAAEGSGPPECKAVCSSQGFGGK